MLCSAATVFPAGQRASAPAAGFHRGGTQLTVLAIPRNLCTDADLFLSQIAELAAIPIAGLTSRLALARRPPETAWIKSQRRSATDELR
jgi:hypothetical protein